MHARKLTPQTLMRLHARALFTHDHHGRITYVNERNGGRAPRFFIGRTAQADWAECRYREDLEYRIIAELDIAARRERVDARDNPLLPIDPDAFIRVLSESEPIQSQWAGPVFWFSAVTHRSESAVRINAVNAHLLEPHLPSWLDAVQDYQPVLAILRDGCAVSVCGSARVTAKAHEAGVETAAPFRGQGFGTGAVSAWATYVADMDAVPLFSTSWQNEASRALAAKLALVQYGSVLHIT